MHELTKKVTDTTFPPQFNARQPNHRQTTQWIRPRGGENFLNINNFMMVGTTGVKNKIITASLSKKPHLQ